MDELVTISAQRHKELLAAERMLYALEVAGVDNWVGYEYAVESCDEDEDLVEED